jgi:hypothetical protein
MREENLKQVRDTQRGHRLTRYTLETLNVKRTAAFYRMMPFGWRGSGAGKPKSSGTHATRERHERNESPKAELARASRLREHDGVRRGRLVFAEMRFDWMDYDLTRSCEEKRNDAREG